MSATPREIKEALKQALKQIKGLRVTDYQPDQPNPPFAFPVLTDVAYHGAMGRGNIVYQFQVTVVAGRAAERSAQSFLDRMISYDDGVREAIEEDRTLGGVVQDCIVLSAGNIVSITANDTTYLTVDFQVQVYG
jgi:hypothetical protein